MGDLKAKFTIDSKAAKKELEKIRKEAEKPLKSKLGTDDVKKRSNALEKLNARQKRDADSLRRQVVKNNEQVRIRQKRDANEFLNRSLKNIRTIAKAEGREVRKTAAQRAETRREQNILSKRSSRTTQSIFQLQQAVEDFSFAGIRGASNNIAFLASQFGGAGGIIALVGLAGISFGQMAAKMSGVSKEAKKAADRIKALVGEMQRLKKLRLKEDIKGLVSPLFTRPEIESAKEDLRVKIIERNRLATAQKEERSLKKRALALGSLLLLEKQRRKATRKLGLVRRQEDAFTEEGFQKIKAAKKELESLTRRRNLFIQETRRQGLSTPIEQGGLVARFITRDPTRITNVDKLRKRLDELREAFSGNVREISNFDIAISGLKKRISEAAKFQGVLRILKESEVGERLSLVGAERKGLGGFELRKFDITQQKESARKEIKRQRELLVTRVRRDPQDIPRATALFKEKALRESRKLDKLREEERKIDKEKERRSKRVGLIGALGDVDKTKVEKNIILLRQQGKELKDQFSTGRITEGIYIKQLDALKSQLKVLIKTKTAQDDQQRAQKKAVQDAKKATRDAARDAERLDRQLASSKSGFASSIFGARLGFAAKVTEQQQGRAKQFARFRGLGGGQDKNIERFFGRVGKSRERGIVRGRLLQLTGEARAAGAAGKPEQQIAALKQRQQLEFQRSAANQNLNSAFKFLQAAQRTQEEIERIFTRRGAGQIQMTAAQIQLQAAKMQLAAVGGAAGAVGAVAIAGGQRVPAGQVRGKARAAKIRNKKKPLTQQEILDEAINLNLGATDIERFNVARKKLALSNRLRPGQFTKTGRKIDFTAKDLDEERDRLRKRIESLRGKAESERQEIRLDRDRAKSATIIQNRVRLEGSDKRKQLRLQDIERRRQFWDNFKQNGANFLFGPVGQSRQQGGNIRATNIENNDNSSQIGNIVNNFNGEVNPQEIASLMTREISASRMRRGRAGKRGTVS